MANYENIQFELIRKEIDPKYTSLVEQLESCFYGEKVGGIFSKKNCWFDGNSKPFILNGNTFDVQPTLEESKMLFDKIHSSIWKQYEVEFHELNLQQSEVPSNLTEDERARALKNGFYLEKGKKKICKIDTKFYNEKKGELDSTLEKDVEAKKWLSAQGFSISVPEITLTKKEEILGKK